jgi:hypothetical protein
MAWFRCMICGENFPGEMIDQPALVGFYVTRFVEADTAESAESLGLQELQADPHLALPDGFEPSGNERVFFEEITEIPAEQVPADQPGFAWYLMEDAS